MEFEVKAGEICGLLGNNGAGKSTVLRSVVGAQDVDAGEIFIGGQRLKEHSISCKKMLGYIPDNQALYPYLTGRQYIAFVSSFYAIPKEEKEKRIEEYTAILNLEHAFDQVISSYSKGMKQKLLIIAAMVHQPGLIVMDEPFSGLDPATVNQLIQIVKEEKRRGAAVIFSSHMLDIAEKICDKIVMLKEGMVVIDSQLVEIYKYGRLEHLLLGE
ncbi:MAG: ABC transporter ATP-binding protein [Lachnospiraceae bacterium]|nr:ABC transporter ATP-binding protein [Lachnospiraceae bacterium]